MEMKWVGKYESKSLNARKLETLAFDMTILAILILVSILLIE